MNDTDRAKHLLATARREAGTISDASAPCFGQYLAWTSAKAGLTESALEIAESIPSSAGAYRSNALACIAGAQIARGDFSGAQRTVGLLGDDLARVELLTRIATASSTDRPR